MGGVDDAVLDSSAVLAIVLDEPGAAEVKRYLPGARISAVNVGEVVAKLRDLTMPDDTIDAVLDGLQIDTQAHDLEAAITAGKLRPATRAAGLSLGDRACLSLARTLALPAVTADRNWASVAEAINVRVQVIR